MRVENHVHIRHILLYHFEKGHKAAEAFRDINELFGDGTIGESQVRKWFQRFKSGNTSLEDEGGRGRPSDFDDQALLDAVEEDESLTTRILAGISMLTNQPSFADSRSLEKCGSWPGGSPTNYPKTTRPYGSQFLPNWAPETNKSPKPHVEARVIESIEDKGWDLLPHPPYSPTEAPTDYHVNRSLKNWMSNKVYEDLDELVDDVKVWIASKNPDFFARGIDMLPAKWEAVLEVDGEYAPE